MTPANPKILDAVANSGTVVSAAVDARFLWSATVQAAFTDGAAAGTLKLQSSNDPAAQTHWNDIPSATASVASGATTTTPILSTPLCYQWIRVAFASSGGAGTITAYLHTVGA